jgi:uncharacterized protein
LIKSPKIHFLDSGLLCHLLGIRMAADLPAHPLRGAIFENFVLSELRKLFLHHGQRAPLFFWRDARGLEVDIVMDLGTRRVPIEIKAGETVAADFLDGLDRYVALSGDPGGVLIHAGDASYPRRAHQVRAWWQVT